MIVLLLTRNRKPDWDSFKKLAGDKSFVHQLINLDIYYVPKRVMQKCRNILRRPDMCWDALAGLNLTAASIAKWA